MKKLLLSLIIGFSILNASGQDISEVTESEFPFTVGKMHVYQVQVTNAKVKHFTDIISENLKLYKAKLKPVKGSDDEYYVEGILVPDVSHEPVSLVYKIQQLDGAARLMVNIKIGTDEVNSESPTEMHERALAYPERLAKKVSIQVLNEQVAGKRLAMADLVKEMDGLTEEKTEIELGILEAQNAITAAETGITNNEAAIVALDEQIGYKNTDMQQYQMELASVDVKGYETQIKEHEKMIESIRKTIEKLNGEMVKIKADMAGLENEQASIESEIKSKSELLAMDPKLSKDINGLNKDLNKITSEIAGKNSELSLVESEIGTYQGQIETEQATIAEIKTKLNAHDEDHIEEQIKGVEKAIKDLEKQKEDIGKDSMKKQESIYGSKAKISEMEVNKASIESAIAAKQIEIDAAEAEINELLERITLNE